MYHMPLTQDSFTPSSSPPSPNTHTHTHTQGEEVKVDYPSWAQFVGCVIVLTSVLSMPIFLLFRLIAFESGRQEALLFLHKQLRDGYKAIVFFKQLPRQTLSYLHSLNLKRQAWTRHNDAESGESPVSDSHTNGSSNPVLNSYGTQTNGPAEHK